MQGGLWGAGVGGLWGVGRVGGKLEFQGNETRGARVELGFNFLCVDFEFFWCVDFGVFGSWD